MNVASSTPERPRPWRVLTRRPFRHLWNAQVAASLGDWVGLLAIIEFAARVSARPEGAVALVMAARVVPGTLFAPFAGVLADRLDRRRTMIVCNLARAGVLLVLPFAGGLWGLVAASFALELLAVLWTPAKEASVPHLVPKADLAAANSLSLAATYGTFLLGSLLFSVLATAGGSTAVRPLRHGLGVGPEALAIWFNAATFVVSAAFLWTLSLPRHGIARRAIASRWQEFRSDLVEGLRFVAGTGIVRRTILGVGVGILAGGAVIPLGPVFADRVLGEGSSGFGLLMTALGCGVGISVLSLSLKRWRLPLDQLFAVGLVGIGMSIVCIASTTTLGLAMLFVAATGLAIGTTYATSIALLQERVADELRGRTFSALYTTARLALLASLAVWPALASVLDSLTARLHSQAISIAGWTVHVPGVRLALWTAGLITTIMGCLTLWSARGARRAAQHGLRHRLRHTASAPTTSTSSPKERPAKKHSVASNTDSRNGSHVQVAS